MSDKPTIYDCLLSGVPRPGLARVHHVTPTAQGPHEVKRAGGVMLNRYEGLSPDARHPWPAGKVRVQREAHDWIGLNPEAAVGPYLNELRLHYHWSVRDNREWATRKLWQAAESGILDIGNTHWWSCYSLNGQNENALRSMMEVGAPHYVALSRALNKRPILTFGIAERFPNGKHPWRLATEAEAFATGRAYRPFCEAGIDGCGWCSPGVDPAHVDRCLDAFAEGAGIKIAPSLDLTGDGTIDEADLRAAVQAFRDGELDWDGDGVSDITDLRAFIEAFRARAGSGHRSEPER